MMKEAAAICGAALVIFIVLVAFVCAKLYGLLA